MEAVLVVLPDWTVGLQPEVVREVDDAEPATLMVLEVEAADWACLDVLTQAQLVSI